jgi:putative membrane protein
MEKNRNWRSRRVEFISKLYIIWFSIGFVLVVTDTLPTFLEWANAAYLIIAGILALVWLTEKIGGKSAFKIAFITMSISFLAEWIGVKTGIWFGQYVYGDAFQPFVFGVPLAIPFAWLVVLTISAAFTPILRNSRLGFSAVAATLAMSFDFLLDPVAVAKQYWIWENISSISLYNVPWTNFASWWVTAFVIYFCSTPLWQKATTQTDFHFTWHNVPLVLVLTLFSLFIALSFIQDVPLALLWSLPLWIFSIVFMLIQERYLNDRSKKDRMV